MMQMESKEAQIHTLKEQMDRMQQDFKSYDEKVEAYHEKVKQETEWQKRGEERRREMYDILNKDNPNWMEPYLKTLRRPLTPEARKKIEESLEELRALPEDDSDRN
jgi:hypothetical protein